MSISRKRNKRFTKYNRIELYKKRERSIADDSITLSNKYYKSVKKTLIPRTIEIYFANYRNYREAAIKIWPSGHILSVPFSPLLLITSVGNKD